MRSRATRLHQKAIFFYKMAQQLNLPFHEDIFKTNSTRKEADYHQWLPTLSTMNVAEIIIGMEYFWDEPYFNFKLVVNTLLSHLFKMTKVLGSVLTALDVDMNAWHKKRLKTEAFKYYIDHFVDELSIDNYITYIERDNDLPVTYLRKAQAALVKWIYENATDYFDNSTEVLLALLKRSEKFDKDFLLRLARHIGPEYYSEIATQYYSHMEQKDNSFRPPTPRQSTLLSKDHLNIYDVAEILEIQNKGIKLFNKEMFTTIIQKADDSAKDYLRKFLYRADGGEHFILDENMQPMTKDYKLMDFPARFQIFRDWQSIDPLRKLWAPIFEDFHIIPVNYDHWN